MKVIEAYLCADGQVETNPQRAIAHDIAYAFAGFSRKAAVGTAASGKSHVDYHVAMELLDHMYTVEELFATYRQALKESEQTYGT